ncbi:MAG: rod shape-determining protein [bacterium]|nr:rod shape-determining protein [bacterium]
MAKLYIRISPERIYAKNLDSGAVFDEPALLAVSEAGGRKLIVAVGNTVAAACAETGAVRIAPFDTHSRVLVDDFDSAAAIFKYAVKQITGRSFIAPSAIVHVTKPLAGGLSAIEKRALQELAQSAGARNIKILDDPAVAGYTPGQLEEYLKRI